MAEIYRGKCFSGFLLIIVLALFLLPQKAGAAPSKKVENYLVGAGDLLSVVVWKNEEVSGEHMVRPDGKITLPLVGDILAAGMTTDAISNQIIKKLELFIESPHVSVIIRDAASNIIYVLGEVNAPGAYPIRDRLTVLQALALAGGFSEFARRNEMALIRLEGDSQKLTEISFREILKTADPAQNLLLKRGDTLVIP
jgi:polysaccharide export outer membrane protein